MIQPKRPPVDPTLDRADYDRAAAILENNSERVLWIVYQTAYSRGLRIDRAPHEIARLAPRGAA